MSKNLPEPQPSEEVDLGQLFKLIGNAFSRFFNFLGSILNNLFLAFVWMVFFVKKHLLKIALAAILGFAYGFIKQKIGDPVYKSEMIIKQNYNTGENLFNTLNYYNGLIADKDTLALSESLQITSNEANMIVGLELESALNENKKIKLFDEYTKGIDSVLATTIDYETFVENSNEFDYQIQKITLKSISNRSYENVFVQIINNIESSQYFKNEQKKDLAQLDRQDKAIMVALKESDSLQKVYQRVLENTIEETTGSQTSITIDNKDDKSITKEFELYNSDLELRRELVRIQREKEDKEHVIEILSSKQDKGTLDNTITIFGFNTTAKILYAVLLSFLVFIILLAIEFLKFLENYKSKI